MEEVAVLKVPFIPQVSDGIEHIVFYQMVNVIRRVLEEHLETLKVHIIHQNFMIVV